jgi:ABC-type glycerol-3-phosphate transport system substrate-binding protein
MALLNFMLNPINQGEYTQAAGWLPTQSRALTVWGDGNEYAQFGDALLENAIMRPGATTIGEAGMAIQQALEDVLLNEMLPAQATSKAVQSITPGVAEPAS